MTKKRIQHPLKTEIDKLNSPEWNDGLLENEDTDHYGYHRRINMPLLHEQLDALWSGLAVMQMQGITIPSGTVIETYEHGDITLTQSIRLDFDLPKPMDKIIGEINAVRRKFPKTETKVDIQSEPKEPVKKSTKKSKKKTTKDSDIIIKISK